MSLCDIFCNKEECTMATGDCSYYDEHLNKKIWGSFITNGKTLRVVSEYGTKSAPAIFGTRVDHFALVALGQKLLSELASGAKQKVLSELARNAEKDSSTSHSDKEVVSYKKAA
jgi:hypothetical protein